MFSRVGWLYSLAYSVLLTGDILVYLAASKSLEFLGLDNIHLYYLAIPLVYYTITALSAYIFDKFVKEFDNTPLVSLLVGISVLTNSLFIVLPWGYMSLGTSIVLIFVGGATTGPVYVALDSAMDKRVKQDEKTKVISKKYYISGLFGFAAFILCYLFLKDQFSVKVALGLVCVSYAVFYGLFVKIKQKDSVNAFSVTSDALSVEYTARGVRILFTLFILFSLLAHLADPMQTLQTKLLLDLNHENQFIYGSFYYVGSVAGAFLTPLLLSRLKMSVWMSALLLAFVGYYTSMISTYVALSVVLYGVVVLASTTFKVYVRKYLHSVFSGRELERWLARLEVVYNAATFVTVLGVMLLSSGGNYGLTWGTALTFCLGVVGLAFVLLRRFVTRGLRKEKDPPAKSIKETA